MAPIELTEESEIFSLEVENDSLATYSAVRVVGGEGKLAPRYFSYPSEEFYRTDDKTLTTPHKLASVDRVSVTGASGWVKVGFNGIHDNNNDYPVLMSYGGDTLTIKDDFPYTFQSSNGELYDVVLINKITSRAVSTEAQERIKKKRGGTGIIEYLLEDETISNYNDASLNASRFLDTHKNNIQTIKFSTFEKGFAVGQRITGNVPYYKILGNYYVGAVVVNFILDDTEKLIAQYDIECTSSVYRDNYKTLFYLPQTLSFEIGEGTGNINGFSYKTEVDIIITDVMMPVMDGIKLCKNVKQNIRTCHIPVIILSAKTDIKDQLEGLQVGADDYIPKPFAIAVITSKIQNMMRTRRHMLERYAKSLEVEPEKITFNAMDEELLKRAVNIVEENIDNIEFSTDEFAQKMNMSRSNLHLKLKAITGESAIDFIRKVRFKRATELLKSGRYTVAEVSSMVGFNSSSYFATCFKKYVGCLPTEYIKKAKG